MNNTEKWLSNYILSCRNIRTLSERTLQAYSNDIRSWFQFLEQEEVAPEKVNRDIARLYISSLTMRQLSPATINRTLSSLKGFYQYLEKRGDSSGNPFTALRSQKNPSTLPVYLTNREVEILIDESEGNSFESLRDKTLFELLYSTGCRVSELCALNADAMKNDRILIRGKGGRQRFVFIGKSARDALSAYLPVRQEKLRSMGKGEKKALILDYRCDRLTTRGVYYIIQKYLRKTGLNRKVGAHAFRHAFATELLNEGADIRVVQEMLGHASLSTTQVYTHTGIERIRQVYRRAHPHGRERKRNHRSTVV
ncbi:MAG: hypothetical protein B6241_04590 [Spirochaetaceae bacterium 4572_59]|nr:MAG: hypothetical protein B6241_04590 [Spirochaetaceae bacterium 4572_59]